MIGRFFLAVAALALASAAQAQPGPLHGGRLFISPAGEPFRGGDGLSAWFAGADADHDGAVTLAEFRADFSRFFRVLDADGDGRLDGFELQAYERDHVPELGADGFRGGGPPEGGRRMRFPGAGKRGPGHPGAGREGAARFGLLNVAQPVANADADVDGRVTLAEWMRAADRRFAMLDKEKSGRLTLEALRAPPARRR